MYSCRSILFSLVPIFFPLSGVIHQLVEPALQRESGNLRCPLKIDICLIFLFLFFSTGLVGLLHCRSSTEILPDYWGTFCAGVCPKSVFSFLVAAGFEPTSLSLRSGCINRYPILPPPDAFKFVLGVCGRFIATPSQNLDLTIELINVK